MDAAAAQPCPRCGAALEMVYVHGHGQCARCGENVEACCSGASAFDEAGERESAEGIDPHLFRRMFDELGGPRASVTREALLFALQRWLGGTLDEAAEILAAGVRLGQVRQHGRVLRLGTGEGGR